MSGTLDLFIAINNGERNTAMEIIESGNFQANVTDTMAGYQFDNCEHTVFTYACYKKQEQVAILLLKRDAAYLDYVNDTCTTPLMYACAAGLDTVVHEILDRYDVNINSINKMKTTAIEYAISYCSYPIIERMIMMPNINKRVADYPNSLYGRVCQYRRLSLISLMITSGFEMDENDKVDNIPIKTWMLNTYRIDYDNIYNVLNSLWRDVTPDHPKGKIVIELVNDNHQ